jgi:hypothetical protein
MEAMDFPPNAKTWIEKHGFLFFLFFFGFFVFLSDT